MRATVSQFLRSRRARLRPEEAGVPGYGTRRRVPGLRREELAQLAGVSVTHYTRLEQGRGHSVSAEVLDAVAGALRLSPDEREYLANLVHPPKPEAPRGPTPVRMDLRCLAEGMTHAPALVLDRDGTILAGNDAAEALIGELTALPADRRTWSHLVFLDGPFRSLLTEPEREPLARRHAAYLRLLLSRHPHDPELAATVTSLHRASPEFRRLWAEHEVSDWSRVTTWLHHPAVGGIETAIDLMRSPGPPDQWLATFTVAPGSSSHAALRQLMADRPAGSPAGYSAAATAGPP